MKPNTKGALILLLAVLAMLLWFGQCQSQDMFDPRTEIDHYEIALFPVNPADLPNGLEGIQTFKDSTELTLSWIQPGTFDKPPESNTYWLYPIDTTRQNYVRTLWPNMITWGDNPGQAATLVTFTVEEGVYQITMRVKTTLKSSYSPWSKPVLVRMVSSETVPMEPGMVTLKIKVSNNSN